MTDWSKELANLAHRQRLPCGYGNGLNMNLARCIGTDYSMCHSLQYRTDPLNFGDEDGFGGWGRIVRAYEDKDNFRDGP